MSTAYAEFLSGYEMVDSLLALEVKYLDPAPPPDYPTVMALRGASAVLIVSVFEGYLRDSITEAADDIGRRFTLGQLPEAMRLHAMWATLERAMKGPQYKKTTKLDRVADVRAACIKIAGDRFRSEVFGDTGGNPMPDVVRELFKTIGIVNVFESVRADFDSRSGAPSASTFLEDKLREIVSRRHSIVHTGTVASVSRAQLRDAVLFIGRLSASIDGYVDSYRASVV